MRAILVSVSLLWASSALALPPNIIFVVADDLTACWLGDYLTDPATSAKCNAEAGPTPALDLMADEGVMIAGAWGFPVCSPFRAAALAGTLPRQNGVGHAFNIENPQGRYGLRASDPNLARALAAGGYHTNLIGKWHLADSEQTLAEQLAHPINMGFVEATGLVSQVNKSAVGYHTGNDVGGVDYEDWESCDFAAGTCEQETTYNTTKLIDDAIVAIGAMSEPWFLYLPLQAPHTPVSVPPSDLFTPDAECDGDEGAPDEPYACYRAMTEAMDTELGRLRAAHDSSDTIFIFTADNGSVLTTANATNSDWVEGCKDSVYECGLWVPLIVTGPGIPVNETADILVSAPDWHATILDMAGVENDHGGSDSGMWPTRAGQPYVYRSESFWPNLQDTSLAASRRCIYTESFNRDTTTGERKNWIEAVRSDTRKLMLWHGFAGGPDEYVYWDTDNIYERDGTELAQSGDEYEFLLNALATMNDGNVGDACRRR